MPDQIRDYPHPRDRKPTAPPSTPERSQAALFYLHHHGSGHRRRGTAIARLMQRPVVGCGTGTAPQGWPGRWVTLPADDDPTPGPGADVAAGGVLHWAPRRHRGSQDRALMLTSLLHELRPAFVLVDVSVEVALLVRLCGFPVVVMAMPGDRRDLPHRLAYSVADHVLAPWPAGAHPDHVAADRWLALGAVSGRATTPVDVRRPHRGDAVMVWGDGGLDVDREQVQQLVDATPHLRWRTFGGGHPRSDDLHREWSRAEVVVTHAGQGIVSELAATRTPAVLVAQQRPFDEQHATVAALTAAGVPTALEAWPAQHDWPGIVRRAMEAGPGMWDGWPAHGAARAASVLDGDLAGIRRHRRPG
ncbi:glycosyltransferase [Luteipulveratus sp. YIM 133132]|uniref:Glycosyltransferase n=1 Tax=Luteipulveratus flavus TaxID=3031728 RepID=A0ABT6C7H9_9MICO|nr:MULTISPECIES: glycosyltransferase [unclassified Luteipulveratus]MDE9366459.1 glycosyltransferase [Luteipulveratus sp. YIM 133132]MDF8264267.1 glycosyltransferase [Luteipulveratus sp. YIM 133296]